MTERKANRLINEKSPYLLQHAHNPVEWFPWGDEAFLKAEQEDKPIFLSVGYSTCHWCHVMERESFEDSGTAELLNKHFVSVKVDREERPDIDSVYMTVCQMLTGGGGWPMTIIMTPDRKPFFAGTYFPRESKWGRPGLNELLTKIEYVWTNKREELLSAAVSITDKAQNYLFYNTGNPLREEILEYTFNELNNSFDFNNGGFNYAPKFPIPHNLSYLLRYWKRTGNERALEIVIKTLNSMRRGGIYDHIGWGFHRYSTDDKWLVPHFEKMLYDQASLVSAYTDAWQATKELCFRDTAEEILLYTYREMMSPEGAFYSAEDADSEGEEGKYYTWTFDEIKEAALDPAFIIDFFNVTPTGNFAEETTGQTNEKNILHTKCSITEMAEKLNIGTNQAVKKLEENREKLFRVRSERIKPLLDDKILTDWNGLMIAAAAKAGRVFSSKLHVNHAETAARFILENMRDSNGRLLHRYRDGEAAIQGNIDDYAFFIYGLLELYQTTFNPDYLTTAIELNDILSWHFWDDKQGGYFFTPDYGEKLIVRRKELYDGAVPSGNSMQLMNLLRLSKVSARGIYDEYASKMAAVFSANVKQAPSAYTQFVSGLSYSFSESQEIIIAGELHEAETQDLLKELNSMYLPDAAIVLVNRASLGKLKKIDPAYSNYGQKDDKTTMYICKNKTCSPALTDFKEISKYL